MDFIERLICGFEALGALFGTGILMAIGLCGGNDDDSGPSPSSIKFGESPSQEPHPRTIAEYYDEIHEHFHDETSDDTEETSNRRLPPAPCNE